MDPKPPLWSRTRLQAYVEPGLLILIAFKEFVLLLFSIVLIDRTPTRLIHDWSYVREKAFSNFWQAVSPPPTSIAEDQPLPVPTLEGSLALLNPHLKKITGVVLDLGPGTGQLTFNYPAKQIRKIYGAEPNVDLHQALARNVKASALKDRYEILSCGGDVESLLPGLVSAGIIPTPDAVQPVFDTIIAARVLCTLPHLEDSVDVLYDLLKPGGKLIIVEHVINPWSSNSPNGSIIGRLTQVLYRPWWEFFIQCHIDADTETLLRKVGERAGGWDKVELRRNLEWSTLSWIAGCFTKKM